LVVLLLAVLMAAGGLALGPAPAAAEEPEPPPARAHPAPPPGYNALAEAVDSATTPEALLALVPSEALQTFPELVPVIEAAGQTEPTGAVGYAALAASSSHSGSNPPNCPSAGRELFPGYPAPYGFYTTNPSNNWCMPDSPDNACSFVRDNGLTFDFRAACRQHDLAYYWVPTDRFTIDNQLWADMTADCARRNWFSKPFCYSRAAIYWAGVRAGGGFSFGGNDIPGYNRELPPEGVPPFTPGPTCGGGSGA
jgi:hypothetical protein